MTRFFLQTLCLVLATVLVAVAAAFCLSRACYVMASGLAAVGLLLVGALVGLQWRAMRDMRRAMEMIRTAPLSDRVALSGHSLVRALTDELGDMLQDYRHRLHDEAVR